MGRLNILPAEHLIFNHSRLMNKRIHHKNPLKKRARPAVFHNPNPTLKILLISSICVLLKKPVNQKKSASHYNNHNKESLTPL